MESIEGRRIHSLAAQQRESGNFIEALKLADEAMVAYATDQDLLGFAEVHAERFLTLKHLNDSTGFEGFLVSAKYAAETSVELAEKSGDLKALALPYFNLAKAQETLGELEEAVGSYKKAVENIAQNPPKNHARSGVAADFRVHLATCEYKTGKKDALKEAEQALADLEASEEEQYNKDVWTSGANMRIAEVLKEDNPTKAKEYLQKAKKIIDSNPELRLRLKHWEKLSASF